MTTEAADAQYEALEFSERYYIQTAKSAIESLAHIVEEIGSNEDEAITRRAKRDGVPDRGRILFAYDPEQMKLSVTGDGDGMLATTMRSRLRRVGEGPQTEARRGFFHRGVREVFLAMGGGEIISIGRTDSGEELLSRAVFDPRKGMAILEEDRHVTAADRETLGLSSTGSRVIVPVRRFATKKPKQYEFGQLESQISNCVGLRPMVSDPDRDVRLIYGEEPARTLSFKYPDGDDLVVPKEVTVGGHTGTFWAKVAEKPIKGTTSRRTRKNGILVRGERAAYEVSLGEILRSHPAMSRVVGELRIDAIEALQREADKAADDESQLIYKTDRSGLNPEHPFVEAIHQFIDATLGPLVADLDAGETRKQVSPDMRRQLQKLAREINQVLKDADLGDIHDVAGPERPESDHDTKEDQEPPTDGKTPTPRYVEDGIGFASERIFIEAGRTRAVEVWIDVSKVPVGTTLAVASGSDEIVAASTLSRHDVPEAADDGIAQVRLTIKAGNIEGRHEVVVAGGGYMAALPVHVRFPRASGFISQIVPDPIDWEAGSAWWDPATGVVRVFTERPEFKEAAARAKREKQSDPWKHAMYRQLVVESVREAALWPAAARRAEVEWDELPMDERQDTNGFYRLVQTEFQELDYLLRSKLLKVFIDS
jgi:hypothetical protein